MHADLVKSLRGKGIKTLSDFVNCFPSGTTPEIEKRRDEVFQKLCNDAGITKKFKLEKSRLKTAYDVARSKPKKTKEAERLEKERQRELADAHMVGLLLKEGANTEQKNSSGKTAAQVAQKKDKNGSHREVKRLLTGTAAPAAAGA